jgi:hypothetical protein
MDQGRRPVKWGPVRAGAQALAIVAVAVLGMGGAAVAAPKGDQGPPEHAQGNGPPAAPPAQQQAPAPQGQAKGHAKQSTAGTQTTTGGDAHGRTGGGHDKARGQGHVESGSQATTGRGNGGGERGSAHAKAGKVTLCHATGSETNPFVEITVSANAIPNAHDVHQHDEDIIPAPASGCPGGSSSGNGPGGNGGPPPGVVSTPGGQTTAGETPDQGVGGVSEEGGSGPSDDGGVLGANQGGGDEAGAARETTGSSLPFTGLGLGLLAAIGLLLAVAGSHLRRRAA